MAKRVLIIASDVKTLLRFRYELIKQLILLGCEVIAIVPSHLMEKSEAFQIRGLGVELRGASIHNTKIGICQDIYLCFELYREIKRIKPDIILAYTIKPVIYGAIAARLAGVKNVYPMITGIGFALMGETFKRRLFQKLVKCLYRIAMPCCQKVFFQNKDDAGLFIKGRLIKKEQAILINGSGVDLAYYQPSPLPQLISFLFIGRIIREKGIFEFIEAAKKLKQKYVNVDFKILGGFHHNPTGLKREYFFNLIAEAQVKFLGEVSDVREYLASCSVFVLPSYREGTPRSALEAMAMGRPVIATDVPGCRETVIEGVNGFLVSVKNSDMLVEKMEYFIQNPASCVTMGAESRKLAEQKFDVHQVNKVIVDTILGSN